MRTGESFPLPVVSSVRTMQNEQTLRRTIEQYFEDLRIDVINNRDTTDKPASLAMRRHQFLLMGAK
jgi:hypothetical protein